MRTFVARDHALHDPPFEIVGGAKQAPFENPRRADAIAAALEDDHDLEWVSDVTDADLDAVHDRGFLAYVRSAWAEWKAAGHGGPLVPDTFAHGRLVAMETSAPRDIEAKAGYYCFDAGTTLVEGTYAAARSAAGAAAAAARAVAAGVDAAFALARPPGHHAGRDFYGGYCFFNNAAVAASILARASGSRVAVLDIDYHHGNGTQHIFWDDASVLTVSLHADPEFEYPYYTGRAEETGGPGAPSGNLNLPLAAGTTGEAFLAALGRALVAIEEAGARSLVVAFGADTAGSDPLGTFALEMSDFDAIGAAVGALSLPTAVIMEGGYDIDATAESVRRFLGALPH